MKIKAIINAILLASTLSTATPTFADSAACADARSQVAAIRAELEQHIRRYVGTDEDYSTYMAIVEDLVYWMNEVSRLCN